MTRSTFVRAASGALAAMTLACGDSTAPNVALTEAQVGDLLEAMTAVAYLGANPATGQFIHRSGETANATVTVAETVDCPNGGSATVNGTVTHDEEANTLTAQVTQGFAACAGTSKSGRVWTFDGNPDITTNLSASATPETGSYSITATQVGGIKFASNLGAGSCAVNLSLTVTGTETSMSATLTGSACGRNIQRTVTVTE